MGLNESGSEVSKERKVIERGTVRGMEAGNKMRVIT